MNVNNMVADPDNWDKIAPPLGDYPLRPYNILAADPYCAPPGFYANDEVLAFLPGWDGIDGGDAVYWYDPPWPTVARVREAMASRLVSSWLVQDRDDLTSFHLGEEPGSIVTPWGVVPAEVIFAPRGSGCDDAPWENLNAILGDVDKALEAGAPAADGYVGWRLGNVVPAIVRTDFARNPLDGALVARFTPRRDDHVIVFLWAADGRARGGVREEYEDGAVIPVPTEVDLAPALRVCADA